jgi:hypothetical protein
MKSIYFKSFLILMATLAIAPFRAHADEDCNSPTIGTGQYECRFMQLPANLSHGKTAHYVCGKGESMKWAAKTVIAVCENNVSFGFLVGASARACDTDAISDQPQNRLTCGLTSEINSEANLDIGFAKHGTPFVGNDKDLQALLNAKDPDSDPAANSDQAKTDDPSQLPAGSATAPAAVPAAPAITPALQVDPAN